jgi:alkylation response protein AidB-like acyl-CoA dehydrogenase
VDFELTADQVDLVEGTRNLLAGRFPMTTVRALEDSPGAVDRRLWRELAETGVFSLRQPEVGLGWAESALVFEELGRALVPGPLVATHLACGQVDGEVVGMVDASAHGPVLVEHLDALDALVVVDGTRVAIADLAAVRASATLVPRPLDPLTPLHLVRTMPKGEQVGDASTADRLRLDGTVLTAALLAGSAQAVTELAVAYAKEREQFGRPIGGFQAVKHILADMQTRASVAQAALYSAGVMVDDPEVGDPLRAASVAKITAGEAAVRNGKAAIQVHGGMGFTWEVDAHLHLKRAWFLDTTFGSTDHHAEVIAHLL